MTDRRLTTTHAILAGLLAGSAILAGTTVLSASSAPSSPNDPSPVEVRNAAHDDTVDDVSGPCDELEHADDPRCGGTDGTVAASPTSSPSTVPSPSPTAPSTVVSTPSTTPSSVPTSTPSPAPVQQASRTLDAAGAGTVRYDVAGSTLTLVSASPAAGWVVEIEQAGGGAIDLDFRSGARRVQVDIEFEDGAVRERVRVRDAATDSETRIEDGEVVRQEPGDDD